MEKLHGSVASTNVPLTHISEAIGAVVAQGVTEIAKIKRPDILGSFIKWLKQYIDQKEKEQSALKEMSDSIKTNVAPISIALPQQVAELLNFQTPEPLGAGEAKSFESTIASLYTVENRAEALDCLVKQMKHLSSALSAYIYIRRKGVEATAINRDKTTLCLEHSEPKDETLLGRKLNEGEGIIWKLLAKEGAHHSNQDKTSLLGDSKNYIFLDNVFDEPSFKFFDFAMPGCFTAFPCIFSTYNLPQCYKAAAEAIRRRERRAYLVEGTNKAAVKPDGHSKAHKKYEGLNKKTLEGLKAIEDIDSFLCELLETTIFPKQAVEAIVCVDTIGDMGNRNITESDQCLKLIETFCSVVEAIELENLKEIALVKYRLLLSEAAKHEYLACNEEYERVKMTKYNSLNSEDVTTMELKELELQLTIDCLVAPFMDDFLGLAKLDSSDFDLLHSSAHASLVLLARGEAGNGGRFTENGYNSDWNEVRVLLNEDWVAGIMDFICTEKGYQCDEEERERLTAEAEELEYTLRLGDSTTNDAIGAAFPVLSILRKWIAAAIQLRKVALRLTKETKIEIEVAADGQ